MSASKMRVSLVEKNGEIRGTIESHGNALFVLECLALIVERIAAKSGVPASEVVRDLYAIVEGNVA